MAFPVHAHFESAKFINEVFFNVVHVRERLNNAGLLFVGKQGESFWLFSGRSCSHVFIPHSA